MEKSFENSKLCSHCKQIHPGPLIDEGCPINIQEDIKNQETISSSPIILLSQIRANYTEKEKELLRDNYHNLKELVYEKKKSIVQIEKEIEEIQKQIHLLELYAKSFMEERDWTQLLSKKINFRNAEIILESLSMADPYT